jgi:heptosyltransferase-2
MIGVDHIERMLVRVPNWVGDVIQALPALVAIRARFPGAELTVLARGEAGTMLEQHSAIDRVVSYQAGRGLGVLPRLHETADRLRRHAYDLGIVLTNAFEGAWLFWWAGIPRRYGFATDGRGWLLTDPQPCTAETRRLHQADYYLALLAGLGVTVSRSWQRLEPTVAERAAAMERLTAAGWRPERPLIALCPGAGYGSAKRWPLDRYGLLARRLIAERGATALVLGGPAERSMGKTLLEQVGSGLIDLTGRTSLREALAVLSCATVVVSNDSGLLHMAAASGRPVVALFGPTDPKRTGPTPMSPSAVTIVRRPVACSPCELRECPIDHRCMDWLNPDEVHEAVCRSIFCGGPCGEISESGRLTDSAARTDPAPSSSQRAPSDAPTPLAEPAAAGRPAPVVFLDRDGTLNRDVGYLCDPNQMELLPRVAAALRDLRAAGVRTVIVTNQSGVARGALTEAQLHRIHERLGRLLEAQGASIDAMYYCPHHPDDRCHCRKPDTGLVERAREQLSLELDRSAVVGDKLADVQLAHRIGATSVLVRTGHGEQVLKDWPVGERPPDHVANDLHAAVQWILGHWRTGPGAGEARGLEASPPQGSSWGTQAIDAMSIPDGPTPHMTGDAGSSRRRGVAQ